VSEATGATFHAPAQAYDIPRILGQTTSFRVELRMT
jgi:hypothetical protein